MIMSFESCPHVIHNLFVYEITCLVRKKLYSNMTYGSQPMVYTICCVVYPLHFIGISQLSFTSKVINTNFEHEKYDIHYHALLFVYALRKTIQN